MISVIIPCYNASNTLGIALDSLVEQHFSPLEVIVVNDGSSDNPKSVVEKYKERLNIVYICQENSGVSSARNNGIIHAKGDYIMFLDADDFYGKNYISNLYRAISKNNADIVICRCSYNNYIGVEGEGKSIFLNFREFSKKLLKNNRDYQFCTAIYKSNIINKYNILFSQKYTNREDELFMWSYLIHCNSIMELPNIYYHYIRQEQSASYRIDERRFSSVDAANDILALLKDKDKRIYQFYKRFEMPKSVVALMRFFAKNNQKELYDKFCDIYYQRRQMEYLIFYPKLSVSLCALIALISPIFFFHIEKRFKF